MVGSNAAGGVLRERKRRYAAPPLFRGAAGAEFRACIWYGAH